ncbi:MAG: hypothetical protein ACREH3_05600 [Geminicoccales bacterium]
MQGTERQVARHYAQGDLEKTVLEALVASGKDLDRLTPADLAPVDAFHIGGRQATIELAAQLDITPDMHILDIGCGTGEGALRFPVPWAADPQASFVADAAAYHRALEDAGFEIRKERDRSALARAFFQEVAARAAEARQHDRQSRAGPDRADRADQPGMLAWGRVENRSGR